MSRLPELSATASNHCSQPPQQPPLSNFDQNSPRPTVIPGEETTGSEPLSQQPSQPQGCAATPGWDRTKPCRTPPIVAPRRSSLPCHNRLPDGAAPLGFEPEGASVGVSPCEEGSGASPLPAHLRWALNLQSLVEDPVGSDMFRNYPAKGSTERCRLDFWFACEGLRVQTEPSRINAYSKVIYKSYFTKNQLALEEGLRASVQRYVKGAADCGKLLSDVSVFEPAQLAVWRLITDTTYPSFLGSKLYLDYVHAMENTSSSGSGSGSCSARGEVPEETVMPLHHSSLASYLPTKEAPPHPYLARRRNSELASIPEAYDGAAWGDTETMPRLTADSLQLTQKLRAVERTKPEAFAGVYLQQSSKLPPYAKPYHSSYNPVSRQCSELQSLSTESDSAMTSSSIDGSSSKGHHRGGAQKCPRHLYMNRDTLSHLTTIPRTQRLQKEQQVQPMQPDRFAALLTERLEKLAMKQGQEARDRRLLEAIRDRLAVDDDNNDQDILDQHVSRVWSDRTPSKTPAGVMSPRPVSPPPDLSRRPVPRGTHFNPINTTKGCGNGASGQHMASNPPARSMNPYVVQRHTHAARKEKEGYSLFSQFSDSGNVHDFPSDSEHRPHMIKSRSMPDYGAPKDLQLSGHEVRIRSNRERMSCSSGRRSSSKKDGQSTDIDSGVSVKSDVPPMLHSKDSPVWSWLQNNSLGAETEHYGGPHSESNSSCSGSGEQRSTAKQHCSGRQTRAGPEQPIAADPSMPPLPCPHTPTQLEEARRRILLLDEEPTRHKLAPPQRQRFSSSGKEVCLSGNSTLRGRGAGRGHDTPQHTTVVISFCDEPVPYRTRVAARPGSVTLRHFKEVLPKKGSYRYFFKTECDEDLDTRAIHEERSDENDVLPLWEGKVMALVRPVE